MLGLVIDLKPKLNNCDPERSRREELFPAMRLYLYKVKENHLIKDTASIRARALVFIRKHEVKLHLNRGEKVSREKLFHSHSVKKLKAEPYI
jgi:hypothetical protein